MSLELFSAMSIKVFGQHVLTIAHVDVNMNLSMRWQMLNNLKKIQIIKTMALKWKVKCDFMKCGDNILEGGKH
jgi:hypothetical protein